MDFLDVLLALFFLFALSLLGGIIYLIFLPFKKRLLKSGKLSDILDRQINCTIIFSVCLTGGILYSFKDHRTPSAELLERTSNVKLPSRFKVLKDEYHDMMQDYCIYYNIKFEHYESMEFIKSIKKSKFYIPKSFHKEIWKLKGSIRIDSKEGIWLESPKGYHFESQRCNIHFDTIANILKYEEYG